MKTTARQRIATTKESPINMLIKKHLLPIFQAFLSATFIIIFAAALGYICLIIVYSLPTEPMRQNTLQSAQIFLKKGDIHKWPKNITGNKIDNYTSSIMLNIASFPNRHQAWQDALLNPRLGYIGKTKGAELFYAVHKEELPSKKIINYARYWHGYLLFIKPLLMVGNIMNIVAINTICQIALLLFAIYLIYKRLNLKQALAFLVAVLYINPLSTGFSPHYSSDYIITLLAIISLLSQQPKIRVWKIFLFIGIITAYFDLLTAPLITLCFPLIIQTLLQKNTLKEDTKKITVYSIAWSYGYSGMWFMKWLIATILTKENIITEGLKNLAYRTYGNGSQEIAATDWSFSHALNNNLAEFYCISSALIILIYLLLICLSYFIKKYRITKDYRAILLIFISLYPFLWYAIAINHSIIHPLFTYRNLTITIYAIISACVVCLQSLTYHKRKI